MIIYNELLNTDKSLIKAKILNNILQGNSLEILKLLPSEFVDMSITSPPYFGLRNYETKNVVWDGIANCDHKWTYYKTKGISGGTKTEKLKTKGQENYQIVNPTENAFCEKCGAWYGELGQEPTVKLFIKHLADIFDEVKRILKPTGSFYLNISDSFMGSNKPSQKNIRNKSLMGIPERIMLELTDRGWILRNKIVWEKNAVPESMNDRFTRTWEYMYFFTKEENYYFEQQLEESTYVDNRPSGMERNAKAYREKIKTGGKKDLMNPEEHSGHGMKGHSGYYNEDGTPIGIPGMRNVRDVWKINTQPFISKKYGDFEKDHFASYPEALVRTPIEASVPKQICSNCGKHRLKVYDKLGESSYENMKGKDTSHFRSEQGIKQNMRADRECYERPAVEKYIECGCEEPTYNNAGIVLDPFNGTGTTCVEAIRQGVNYIGLELNEMFAKISEARIKQFRKSEEMIKKRMKKNVEKFL